MGLLDQWLAAAPLAEKLRGLPPGSVAGLLNAEGTAPGVVSNAGAITPLQLLPSTLRDPTMNMDPRFVATHPDAATNAGAAYLAQQMGNFGNLPDAYAAYNAGPGGAQQWINAGRPDSFPVKNGNIGQYVQNATNGSQQAAPSGDLLNDVTSRLDGGQPANSDASQTGGGDLLGDVNSRLAAVTTKESQAPRGEPDRSDAHNTFDTPPASFFDTYVTTPARRALADLTGAIGSADSTMAPTGQGPIARAFAGQFLGVPAAFGYGPGAADAAKVRMPTTPDMNQVIGRGQNAPTAGGRIAQTALEGALTALPLGVGGAASASAVAIPTIMGAASGGAQQSAGELGLPPMVQQAAGYLPLLIGAGIGGAKMGAKAFGLTDPTNVMKSMILDALAADNVSPQQALHKYQNWRMTGAKPEALVDLGGDATRRLARSLYTAGGDAASTVEKNLGNRSDLRPGRILGDFNNTALNGNSANAYDVVGQLQKDRSAAATPLYDQAYAANPAVSSPEINAVLETPAGKKAIAESTTLMANDGVKPQPATDGNYSLQQLDYAKRALDDQIKNATPGSNEARILTGLKNRFLDALDTADTTGAYAKARASWSGPTQSMNAVDMGMEFLGEKPEIIKAQMAKLSPADQDFVRIGFARALKQKMGQAGGSNSITSPYSNIPRNTNMSDSIQAVFGSQFAYDRFANLVSREANMARSENAMGFRDTQSANKLADLGGGSKAMEVAKDVAGTGVRMAGTQSFLYPLAELGLKWATQAAGRAKGITPEVAGLLAPALTDPAANIEGLLGELMKRSQKPKPSFLQNYVAPAGLLSGRYNNQ